MTGDERLLSLETTLHQHMLEDARVLAQIPIQLESIKDMITSLRDDIKGAHETIERHSSRILVLEQAPMKAATDELAARKEGEKELRKTVGSKILDVAIKVLTLGAVTIGTVLATAWTGLLQAVQHVPPTPPPVP